MISECDIPFPKVITGSHVLTSSQYSLPMDGLGMGHGGECIWQGCRQVEHKLAEKHIHPQTLADALPGASPGGWFKPKRVFEKAEHLFFTPRYLLNTCRARVPAKDLREDLHRRFSP